MNTKTKQNQEEEEKPKPANHKTLHCPPLSLLAMPVPCPLSASPASSPLALPPLAWYILSQFHGQQTKVLRAGKNLIAILKCRQLSNLKAHVAGGGGLKLAVQVGAAVSHMFASQIFWRGKLQLRLCHN